MSKQSERMQAKAKTAAFLNAWKEGVQLAGTAYFNVTCESVERAVRVDELQPNLRAIFQAIGILSTYERVFILSMCQFYCDSDVRAGCEEHGLIVPSLPDIANLDDERRSIIVALMENYAGW